MGLLLITVKAKRRITREPGVWVHLSAGDLVLLEVNDTNDQFFHLREGMGVEETKRE